MAIENLSLIVLYMSAIKLKTKLVKPNFSLTLCQEQKTLIDYVLEEMKGIDVDAMKLQPEFLMYISEIIENQVAKKGAEEKDAKPNKMEILIEILKKLFPKITQSEIEACRGIVEFLLKNKMVKKTKLTKIMSFYLKKKFLS